MSDLVPGSHWRMRVCGRGASSPPGPVVEMSTVFYSSGKATMIGVSVAPAK